MFSIIKRKNYRFFFYFSDIHKLARDFVGFDKELMLNNCVDSRTQARDCTGLTGWSMEKLTEHFVSVR